MKLLKTILTFEKKMKFKKKLRKTDYRASSMNLLFLKNNYNSITHNKNYERKCFKLHFLKEHYILNN